VATNAIKHGIFTKCLIVSSVLGQESEDEYQALLNNLVDSLLPCNQMESLLVEKIAVDFWRLRRTIRFETGSIVKQVEALIKEFYSYGTRDNCAIEKNILYNQQVIEWNSRYIEFLKQGKVSFNEPIWKEETFESDIIDDLYRVAKSIKNLAEKDSKLLYGPVCLTLDELHAILQRYGLNGSQEISAKLIEVYTRDSRCLEEENEKLGQQKISNKAADKPYARNGP
jgi:hypothetical protein